MALAVLVGVRATSDGNQSSETTTQPTEQQGGDSPRFVDVTSTAGLDVDVTASDRTGEDAMTAGAGVADLDGDGHLDVVLTNISGPPRLFINDGSGGFENRSTESGFVDPDEGSLAVGLADIDGDGHIDAVITGDRGNPRLYLNDGSARFTDATAGSGLDTFPAVPAGSSSHMHGVTFGDINRDGRLDMVFPHWDSAIPSGLADPAANSIEPDENGSIVCARARWLAERNYPRQPDSPPNRARIFMNDGEAKFRDITATSGVAFEQIMGFTATFVDLDGDRWDDLLITGDFCTSRVFRNVAGETFTDMTEAFGLTDENAMGSVITDLNADGRPDWFVTSIGTIGDEPAPLQLGGFGYSGNRLYVSGPDTTWTDVSEAAGIRKGGWGWGAAVEDFANDGHPSIAMTNGYRTGDDDGASAVTDPLVLWRPEEPNATETTYRDIATSVGLDDRNLGRALVPFDMDRDGDLDLLVANFGAPPRLFRNDSPPQHWLTIRLDDPSTPANRAGLGAVVTVNAADRRPITRWMTGGGSYESQNPTEVHFGLGDNGTVDRIEVLWPGSTTPQIIEAPTTDAVLVIERRET